MNIQELADICGVSKKTVSRIINNESHVNQKTREKVLEAMKKHHYRPNTFARNLNGKRTKTVLFSIRKSKKKQTTSWIDEIIDNLISAAGQRTFRILVESYFGTFDIQHSALSEGGLVDAIVIFYEEQEDARIEYAKTYGLPYLVYGKSVNNAPYVSSDNRSAMHLAYEFLFSRNLHTSALFLGASETSNMERALGAEQACKAEERDKPKLTIIRDIVSVSDMKKAVLAILASPERLPDCLVIPADSRALGAYAAITDKGLRIPEDISVMGYNDFLFTQFLSPPLTTVAKDFPRLAHHILEAIQKMIDTNDPIKPILVPAHLIERESTRGAGTTG